METMLDLINQYVYRPDVTYAGPGVTPADLGLVFEEVTVQTVDGVAITGWFLPAKEARLALLYCHGNAGDIRDWYQAALPFIAGGISVLMWDYRGYGRSEGQPSEEGLYLDGEAVWSWLQDRARHETLPAALVGKSLGSAVAIHLAAHDSPQALVLDSAFTSMREIVHRMAGGVPLGVIPSLFESLEKTPGIKCPTLVIHGGQDSLVPVSQGEQLYNALKCPKALYVIAAAEHNDISSYPAYQVQVQKFLLDPTSYTVGGD
jgi:fermentation-respiration switch protein FrsA (DUF1100 family)